MRKELDEALCKKYPEIFRDRHGNIMESLMPWGFECSDGWYNIIDALCANIQNYIRNNRNEIDTKKRVLQKQEYAQQGNWDAVFTDKSEKEWLATATPDQIEKEKNRILNIGKYWQKEIKEIPQVVAVQVKEKYGTLRFYVNYEDGYIRGLISMAESMSGRTCEVCGNPGTRRDGGWIQTLCDEHAKETGYEEEQQ